MEILTYPMRLRTILFVILLGMINLVGDGWPKRPTVLGTQLILLPYSLVFLWVCWMFFRADRTSGGISARMQALWTWRNGLWLMILFEFASIGIFYYEARHFAGFGYRLYPLTTFLVFAAILGNLFWMAVRRENALPRTLFTVVLGCYVAGLLLVIASFPLNYLRSDMMFVIKRANIALLSGGNPYARYFVADRTYDFPYLPGMVLAFTPAQALHLDLRFASMAYVVAAMGLLYWVARPEYRHSVTVLAGLFALCPFVQYRHELYMQGYWFALVAIFVLMQRGKFVWSAIAFGISMTVLQFSWVLFPFFLMNALRRGGWKEVGRMMLPAGATALAIMAPFHTFHSGSIGQNTVGQWVHMGVNARPINLSYWAAFVVRPDHLQWLQLAILSVLFFYCWAKGKCADLADTLRWMCMALLLFLLFNILVDGYFYLVLLLLMLMYTCAANRWWRTDGARARVLVSDLQ